MKTKLLVTAVAAILGSSMVSAQIVDQNPGASNGNIPQGGPATLYSQLDDPGGNGAPAQNFEMGYEIYDNEAADDFVVTDAEGWDIESIDTVMTTSVGAPDSFRVTFYADNSGLPGSVICSRDGETNFSGSYSIVLSSPCSVPQGTVFMGIAANQSFAAAGQNFWSNRATVTGNPAAWINPGDGFGSGCTDWGDAGAVCGVGGGGGSYDFLFAVNGQVSAPAVVYQVPTLAPLGLGILALGVGIAGYRRQRKA
ncbi:MAG: hypothetical protein ACWA5R_12170 [bacterium]